VAYASTESPGDKTAAYTYALTNVAVMLDEYVAGRVVIELDPRLANDESVFLS
jgi:hypothetical protein